MYHKFLIFVLEKTYNLNFFLVTFDPNPASEASLVGDDNLHRNYLYECDLTSHSLTMDEYYAFESVKTVGLLSLISGGNQIVLLSRPSAMLFSCDYSKKMCTAA